MNLYMAHVGFYEEENGIYEIHSNIFVVAEDIRAAKENIKNKPIFIEKKMHIDGIQAIYNIDGYDINLHKNDPYKVNPLYHYEDIKDL